MRINCFNPWFIGRVGINSQERLLAEKAKMFQSLVYWKGGDKSISNARGQLQQYSFNPWFIGRVGINLTRVMQQRLRIAVSILGLLEGWG